MPEACTNTIGKSILNDCTEVKGKGLESDAYIVDRDFIDRAAVIKTANVISVLPLLEGKQGYKIHTRRNEAFTGATDTGKTTNFGTAIDRSLPLIIESRNAANAVLIDQLRDGKYVIIVEKRPKDASITADQQFIVYGYEQGMTFKDSTHDPYSDDSNGGWIVNMQELDAPSTMIFFASTTYEASKAALESLLVPVVIP
jgi:hypothetical protein